MADKFLSERNLKFLLQEVLNVQNLTAYSLYQDHSLEVFDLVLDTAVRMGREMLWPCLGEMDKNQPEFINGQVKVHPLVRQFLRECGEGGWISARAPYELDGQQLPMTIASAVSFIFGAANYSASIYPMLSMGAAHLIESFGSRELIETYLPKMFAGQWQGTMALTEPQAGSSLADIATQAEPTAKGYYKINGQKIFISAGDHDGADNVVHLMLARIKGAPAGVKGISLFVVPKLRPGPSGELTPNDVNVAGIFHKLGYRGAPITQLGLGENDDCRGFLVGEAHKGLSYMFQMMNEARLEVGIGAAGISSAAYYAALDYTRQRPQGRKITSKDPTAPQIPIIEHPDVKRMLLFQKTVVEGSLAIVLTCAMYEDLAKVGAGPEKERYQLLLDLLTPVAKTYPSEMGVLAVSQGLQCLGGYGYCDEFPLEQYYRDQRINPIHEGTTGIQALDLLGRKVVRNDGRALTLFLEELQRVTDLARQDAQLAPYADRLEESKKTLEKVTQSLIEVALQGRIEPFLADATLYLELFGLVTLGWQWLVQGLAVVKGLAGQPGPADSNFYQGKIFALKYFFHYELPKVQALARRLLEKEAITLEMKTEFFQD